jgi:hypothetical protein
VSSQGATQFSGRNVYGKLGDSRCRGQVTPVRESAMKSVGKPDAGNRHVRLMNGVGKRGGGILSAPAPGAGLRGRSDTSDLLTW